MKVLIADDDPVSRRLLQVSLTQAGYPISIAENGADALRMLKQSDSPRLAVIDWMMPEMDGVEVCRAIRKVVREHYVYIILLTAKGQQEEIIEGLEAGADDYITKPYDLPELKARLRAGRRIVELQEQLLSAQERLRIQAMHDFLTGIFNRMAILEALDRELARFARDGTQLSVIMADIDHFKRINDTLGHAAGDAVIRETSRRMKAAIRTYDMIGRYGGEEFLIVAPGCGLADAIKQAERLRQSICGEAMHAGSIPVQVTASFGVAEVTGQVKQANELLRIADEALYAAKHDGRDRVAVSSQIKLSAMS